MWHGRRQFQTFLVLICFMYVASSCRCSPASTKPGPEEVMIQDWHHAGVRCNQASSPLPTAFSFQPPLPPPPLLPRHLLLSCICSGQIWCCRHILIRHSSKIAGALISHDPLGTQCPRGLLQLPASYPTHFLLIFSSSSFFFWLVYMTCARYRPSWISRSLLPLALIPLEIEDVDFGKSCFSCADQ
jgi:hypothetical protein